MILDFIVSVAVNIATSILDQLPTTGADPGSAYTFVHIYSQLDKVIPMDVATNEAGIAVGILFVILGIKAILWVKNLLPFNIAGTAS